jgi:Glycosyl transferase family 2
VRRVVRPAGQAVEVRVACELAGNALEQVGRVLAVVVGEGDEVRLETGQGDVARTRETAGSAQALDPKRGLKLREAIVIVLIDEQHAEVLVRLAVQRCEQSVQLGHAVDRGDDKVESHGRTLTLVPLVSVLMSVHNDDAFVAAAIESVLRQTLSDLELIVVDDASTDETPVRLDVFTDRRIVRVRNQEKLGLAASLNLALDRAQGEYVARLDADDVAFPHRLERQVAEIGDAGILGTAVHDLDAAGRQGRFHRNPVGPRAVRWHALFSSPFFHPTVLLAREPLEAHGLRYDPAYLESEDYDLWTRLLQHVDGANLAEALVAKRVHASQASARRRDMQESFQRQVALREIEQVAPGVDRERAWRVGARKRGGSRPEFLRLLAVFQREHGRDREVLSMAARAVLSPRRRS